MKERIKTILLTCLVISSLVLSVNIWYEKELWSMDYSSFVYSLKNFFTGKQEGPFSDTEELMELCQYSPEFVSFTYGSQKMIVYNASPGFVEAHSTASQILASLQKEGNLVSITDEEYLNLYKTNSMMLKFPYEIGLKEFLKQEDAFFDAVKEPSVSTLVVGIDNSQTNYLSFRDQKTGHAYRMPVKTNADTQAIATKISENAQNDSFAFELNFDQKQDDAQRILFNRFVAITLGETALRPLKAEPVYYSSAYDGVFKAFRIVKNSARTYRDKENTIHFIENRSTLKIFEKGAFRFEATDRESGIALTGREETEAVTEFVNLLYRNIAPQSDAFLVLTAKETRGNKTAYQFHYQTQNGALYSDEGASVTVLTENGVIMEYEQNLYLISLAGGEETTTGVIEAYDSLYNLSDFSQKSKLTVSSMVPCHILSDGVLRGGWVCGFSDDSISYFIP